MKTNTRLVLASSMTSALITAALFFSLNALADGNPATTTVNAPYVVPYDGYLESDGLPVDGPVDMRFSFYEDTTTATSEWTETWAGDGDSGAPVSVHFGQFNVMLGAHVSLNTAVLDAETLFIGIEVRESGGDWVELAGRQQIGVVPFAMWSAESSNLHVAGTANVDGNAVVGGTLTADGIRSSDGTTNFSNSVSVSGDAGVSGDATVGGLIVNSAGGGAVPGWVDADDTHGMRIHSGSDNAFFGMRSRSAGNANAYDAVVYFGDDPDDDLVFTTEDNGDVVTFHGNGNATFGGNVNASGVYTGRLGTSSCIWRDGSPGGLENNTFHTAQCADGEYMQGWQCYASDRLDGDCRIRCCTP